MEGTIAEIRMFAPTFAPRYWALCNGQLLPINTNQALFSLLGTTFGGNGITTFALPDMRGRVAVGTGQASGISSYQLGEKAGAESAVLLPANIPSHNHAVTGTIKMPATSQPANAEKPAGNYFAGDGSTKFNATSSGVTMKSANLNLNVANAGNSTGVTNMMPFLGINYIICLNGIFPSRD